MDIAWYMPQLVCSGSVEELLVGPLREHDVE